MGLSITSDMMSLGSTGDNERGKMRFSEADRGESNKCGIRVKERIASLSMFQENSKPTFPIYTVLPISNFLAHC